MNQSHLLRKRLLAILAYAVMIIAALIVIYPIYSAVNISLLKDTEMNHMAKLMFKWAYFNLLLKGVWLGPPSLMMEGKYRND